MPFKLPVPVITRKRLEKSDAKFGEGEPGTWVSFRAATQGDEESMAQYKNPTRREYTDTAVVLDSSITVEDVKREEVRLTMIACDIEAADGSPLFKFENSKPMGTKEFFIAWGQLPPFVANEISEICRVANPQWGPAGKAGEGG